MQASCPLAPTSGGLFPLDELFSSARLRMLAPRRLGKPALRTKRRFGASSGEPQHRGEEEETQAVSFRDAIMMMMIQNSRNWGRSRLATQLSTSVRHLLFERPECASHHIA